MPARLKTGLKQDEFYCVACRGRVKADDMCVKIFRNKKIEGGAPALVGGCKKCDTNVTKFIKHSSVDKFSEKYGKCQR